MSSSEVLNIFHLQLIMVSTHYSIFLGSNFIKLISCTAANYSEFLEDMKEAEKDGQCRFAIYDIAYTNAASQARNKIVFFMW